MADNVKARELKHDGSYVRVKRGRGETPFRVQQEFLNSETVVLPKQKKSKSARPEAKSTKTKKKARAK
jgi:hypothetical protein